MGRVIRRSARIGLPCSIAVVIAALLCTVYLRADPPAPELRDLMGQFQSLSALVASADVVVQMPNDIAFANNDEDCNGSPANPSNKPVTGTLDYWAADQRYKIISQLDGNLAPGMQVQVAYNSQRWQLLRADGTLIDSPQDNAVILPMLPNPLLEVLQFRYPLTDGNSGQYLRLKDVLQDQVPEAFWAVSWTQVNEDGRALERAIFPGGSYEGQSYVQHVFVEPGARNKPVRIDRVGEQGRLTSAEFDDYHQVGSGVWPYRVFLQVFEQGRRVGWMAFTVTSLTVDTEIPQATFTMPHESAARVWIDDEQRFAE